MLERSGDTVRKRKRENALLRSLIINDNVHSEISKIARENPDSSIKSKRNTTVNVNYVYKRNNDVVTSNNEFDSMEARGRKKTRRNLLNNRSRRITSRSHYIQQPKLKEIPKLQESITHTIEKLWTLPTTEEELHSLNNNLEFITERENNTLSIGQDYLITGVKIKFDPLKLLNFQNILDRSKKEASMSIKLSNTLPFHDFDVHEVESLLSSIDNNNSIPFCGAIANAKQYNTTKTSPNLADRTLFKNLLMQSASASYFNANILLSNHENKEDDKKNQIVKRKKTTSLQKSGSAKTTFSTGIEYIFLADHEIRTWYSAPYPEEFNCNKILYICQYCLKYMNSRYVYHRHILKCRNLHPPGNEIYRDKKLSIWEVDGRENVVYCQYLCLLAKLFLNSKTLYYDVEPFIFYVLTELDDTDINNPKWSFVGYFSQEKLNSTEYNLSCILTLPIYQRKGYGQLLMEFSYLLSKRAYKWGTPEKPLSNLGLLSYRNLWKIKCARILIELKNKLISLKKPIGITLEDISDLTGMIPTDVVIGLEQLEVLYKSTDRNQKNARQGAMDDSVPATCTKYKIEIDSWERIEKVCKQWESKNYPLIHQENLIWKPMIFGPSGGINAMGSPIEQPSKDPENNKNTFNYSGDIFKKSVAILTNFMSDDIADPRPIEEVAWDRILNRDDSINFTPVLNSTGWELSFVEPRLPTSINMGENISNRVNNNTTVTSISKENNNNIETETVEEEEDVDFIEPNINVESRSDDESYEEDENGDEDEDDEDEGKNDEDTEGETGETNNDTIDNNRRAELSNNNVSVRRSPRKRTRGTSFNGDNDNAVPIIRRTTRSKIYKNNNN